MSAIAVSIETTSQRTTLTHQAVGQLCSKTSMTHNLAQCKVLVSKAVAAGAQALFLPEASDYISISGEESKQLVRSVASSEFVQGLQEEARNCKLHINVGIHEPAEDGRVKNTLIWIDKNGDITQRYQKLHLFDVDLADGPRLQESEFVERGQSIAAPFQTPLGRMGLLICFDLRFPEPSLSLRRQGAQLITYPSAFTMPTGRAHWEALLRARAIETQSYVLAAAQAGQHNEKRASFGHSMIISPWGEVLARLEDETEPNIATAKIDLQYLEKIRREIPLLRRTDVYPEV